MSDDKDKPKGPPWFVRSHGRRYQVIERASGWIWRTLDTPAQASQWIADATADEDHRRRR